MFEENIWIPIIDENGEEIEVEIKEYFHLDTTDKDYVIYTKNEVDENNNIVFHTGSVIEKDDKLIFTGINDSDEWALLKSLLPQILNPSGDDKNGK